MSALIWLMNRIPRSWRIAILKASAYPEFEVKRKWLHCGTDGLQVRLIDIDEGERANKAARVMLTAREGA